MIDEPVQPTAISPFREDGTQFGWDNTSLKWAMTCLQQYKYKMIDRWDAKNKSHHLLFGGWYAKALEHFYKYVGAGMARDDALAKVLLETLRATWEYARDPEGNIKLAANGKPIGIGWQSPDSAKTRENLIRTIIWYTEHFREDSVETFILANGKPAVEFSFRLEIDYGNFLTGHIDRLGVMGDDLFPMDQKTTGHTISQHFFEQFDLDNQPFTYIYAGQAIYDRPVKGMIMDGAQIAVGFSRFERGYTYRTADQLEEWYENTLYHIEMANQAVRENHFPKNLQACYNCDFKRVCSKTPQLRQRFLEGDFYQRKQWNPLEER